MAATTTAQFARQLRRLGATVAVRDGHEVTAGYRGVEVTSHFRPDVDVFDVACRTNPSSRSAPPGDATPGPTSCARAGPPSPNAASACANHTPKGRRGRSPAAG